MSAWDVGLPKLPILYNGKWIHRLCRGGGGRWPPSEFPDEGVFKAVLTKPREVRGGLGNASGSA